MARAGHERHERPVFPRHALRTLPAYPRQGRHSVPIQNHFAIIVDLKCRSESRFGTLWFAGQGRFRFHRKVARWTFPIWLYVSVTGMVVYLLLTSYKS